MEDTMAERDGKARAQTLANEMQRLLEENLARDPSTETSAAMARVREIRTELMRMGFLVTWTCNCDLRYFQTPSVEVTLWEPKPDLSPEDQKIYDEWFRKMNGIAD